MKRTAITLEQVAERKNLLLAFQKAAKGKRYRSNVQQFMLNFEQNINQLSRDILEENLPYGRFREFQIYDPKQRLIHAACFEDRIFHHALMNIAGEVLERRMHQNSFACRTGKGVHKAVELVQKNLRKHAYYVRIDIAGYFPSINHERLLELLFRCFKGSIGQAQLRRIVEGYSSENCYGLPIGSLTSQYFANYYLNALDFWLSEHPKVKANIRYMDDIIWWCDSRQDAVATLKQVKQWLLEERDLVVKPSAEIHASKQGVTYCGFRILQGAIRLSRRRKRRYQQRRQYWEAQYLSGEISSTELQQSYAAVHAITAGTDSLSWRRENLHRHPPIGL